MHPAAGLPLTRVVPNEGAVVNGVVFPAGTVLGVNSWVAHANPNIFGQDAEQFRPARWLESKERSAQMESCFLSVGALLLIYQVINLELTFVALQFGAGSRTCIGKNISLMEIAKVVPELVRRFEFSLADPGAPLEMENVWEAKQEQISSEPIARSSQSRNQTAAAIPDNHHATKMPSSITKPDIEKFVPVKPTSEQLEYAELVTLDLSTYDNGPQARKKLADELKHAMRTQGFFVVVNHGISIEQIDRQVDIGHHVLTKTPLEEKQRLEGRMKQDGSYQGFKLRNYWQIDQGVRDQIEQYNWNRDLSLREHPSTFSPFKDEVQELNDFVHKEILFRLLTLFAISLDLPEDFFVKLHQYDVADDSWFRYMMYFHSHKSEDMDKTGGVWLKGHCDFGSVTMLFSQPMASLQLMDHFTGKWRWVPYVPGAIVVNAGEMMEWWTGGYYKATIHRVCQPPPDQRNQDRCGLFYFVVPNDEVTINTLLEESSVLREAGVPRKFEPGTEPTSKMYRSARIGAYGQTDLFKGKGKGGGIQEETIAGIKLKHYN
ncbi:hypothetical protein PV10_05462 [Exophiala mesophila]|uniref:Fe2OG dioxygenase domain-containing protein n=1 Tax=Exophiala mesophila TaxID=212818 RepID=A0A0D1XRW4_EXOME|nr:uncharacterized protein PV10_05462 [Exophiala mesophila]KIV90856.1 hypothetical protein PV10_05462 [Exophiala mesophila]